MPNVNITYSEIQSAGQLQAGEQTIEDDRGKLKQLVENLMTQPICDRHFQQALRRRLHAVQLERDPMIQA